MKTIYLDCSAGISGDMTVGAMLDLKVPLDVISHGLSLLGLPADCYSLASVRTSRLGISATHFKVDAPDSNHHRHYSEIRNIIDSSRLSEPVKSCAQRIFLRLAEAEAIVHDVPVDKVHFHEVGAIDSIVDIVGASIALDYLGVEQVVCSTLPYGSGWVDTAHGRLPVPAPATAELIRGFQVRPDTIPGEWVTPTGAAIVSTLCSQSGLVPEMKIIATGYGAGTKQCQERPNLLRAVLGESTQNRDTIFVMETHLDDINPEILGFLMDRIFEAGALDVAFSPLQMKKNRPGIRLTIITENRHLNDISRIILTESTAIGLRYYPVERITLERNVRQVTTSLGPVRVKMVLLPDGNWRTNPEFEECRRLAVEKDLPLLDVYRLIERETA